MTDHGYIADMFDEYEKNENYMEQEEKINCDRMEEEIKLEDDEEIVHMKTKDPKEIEEDLTETYFIHMNNVH